MATGPDQKRTMNKNKSYVPNILKLSRNEINYFSYFGSTMLEYAIVYNLPYKLLLNEYPSEDGLTDYGKKLLGFFLEQDKVIYV